MKQFNIGLVGFGTVGSGVVRIIQSNADAIEARSGVRLALKAVCDADTKRDRGVVLPPKVLTNKLEAVLDDPEIEVVVELVGGTTFAKDLILAALDRGKHVVTANKALLALHGRELFERATQRKRSISFEAGVCGGIPIIRAVRDGYVGCEITQIMGILNGTSNYILTQMAREGASYGDALKEAQEKGYAERDPSLDVNGVDSAHKLAILARLAFAENVEFGLIRVEGISAIEPTDLKFGAQMGYTLKLLAIAKKTDGELDLRVHPAFLPDDHPLSSVNGVFNAVWIRGEATGDTMHYGRGAGQMPTAAAVVSDLVDVALGRAAINAESVAALSGTLRASTPPDTANVEMHYYLRFSVLDKPGVLAGISGALGKKGISIASAHQPEQNAGGDVSVVVVTHRAREQAVAAALKEIDSLDVVRRKTCLIRIEK